MTSLPTNAPRTSAGKKGVQNGGFDDENGNYIPVVGEEIADRYIVVRCADRA